jgi:hypothetical protein
MIRRHLRPDWEALRASRPRWARRLLFHALALVLLCGVASMAVGRLISSSSESTDSGAFGPAAGRGGGSRGSDGAAGATSDSEGSSGGSARKAPDGGVVEFTMESRGTRRGGAGARTGDAAGGARGASGTTVKVRFDPTPRLRYALTQIDALDRLETMNSLAKFMTNYAGELETQHLLGPVETFMKELEKDASMLEAVTAVMRLHGPEGRDALDAVFDLKRSGYEERLNKQMVLKQAGAGKDYKIYSYQQKLWLIEELRGEFNKSFSFE